jgi:putative transposase
VPNPVHLILAPDKADGLRAALGKAHKGCSRRVNFRDVWRGHLWQGRFASVVADERHLLACARDVELNPVHTRLVERPEDWRWSSARYRRVFIHSAAGALGRLRTRTVGQRPGSGSGRTTSDRLEMSFPTPP